MYHVYFAFVIKMAFSTFLDGGRYHTHLWSFWKFTWIVNITSDI